MPWGVQVNVAFHYVVGQNNMIAIISFYQVYAFRYCIWNQI